MSDHWIYRAKDDGTCGMFGNMLSGGGGNGSNSGGRQSFQSGLASPFDVVVLDYKMPGKDGMEVAKEILQINPHMLLLTSLKL